ncbi:hypothetical protein FOA52_001794 [Chlamydomonas sp. UWO 241]|nr:hypothetical protein FOA52_001794 [Chlamydomonas sp. UWO 241]
MDDGAVSYARLSGGPGVTDGRLHAPTTSAAVAEMIAGAAAMPGGPLLMRKKHRSMRWLVLHESGGKETLTLERRQLRLDFGLDVTSRDFRLLDSQIGKGSQAYGTIGQISVRDHTIVFTMEFVKVLILADKVIIPLEDERHAYSERFNLTLEQRVRERAKASRATGGNFGTAGVLMGSHASSRFGSEPDTLNTDDETEDVLPFELCVLETALGEICTSLAHEVEMFKAQGRTESKAQAQHAMEELTKDADQPTLEKGRTESKAQAQHAMEELTKDADQPTLEKGRTESKAQAQHAMEELTKDADQPTLEKGRTESKAQAQHAMEELTKDADQPTLEKGRTESKAQAQHAMEELTKDADQPTLEKGRTESKAQAQHAMEELTKDADQPTLEKGRTESKAQAQHAMEELTKDADQPTLEKGRTESKAQAQHAMEELTKDADQPTLKKVRRVKTRHQRLTGRVKLVVETLERLMEDDDDMMRCCLTREKERRALKAALEALAAPSGLSGGARRSSAEIMRTHSIMMSGMGMGLMGHASGASDGAARGNGGGGAAGAGGYSGGAAGGGGGGGAAAAAAAQRAVSMPPWASVSPSAAAWAGMAQPTAAAAGSGGPAAHALDISLAPSPSDSVVFLATPPPRGGGGGGGGGAEGGGGGGAGGGFGVGSAGSAGSGARGPPSPRPMPGGGPLLSAPMPIARAAAGAHAASLPVYGGVSLEAPSAAELYSASIASSASLTPPPLGGATVGSLRPSHMRSKHTRNASTVSLADRGQMITIVSAYSPTEAASDEEAGDFYLRVAALADKANDKRDLLIVAGGSQRRAWDSSQLRRPAVRREFNLQLSDRFGLLEAVPPEGADAQAEYDAMAAAIREVATNHLAPSGSRRRRGWQFTLSQRTLRLMDARQRAHTAWLRSKSAAAKRERNRANRAADAAVQRDRERWISQQVAEAQDMLRKKNLRQFARACDRLAGRSRSHQIPPAMRDVSGALHSGPDGVLKAMTESFDKLYGGETKLSDETLNQLENDVAAFELTRATEVDEAHGRPPDLAETEACVRALRSAAAPGG